MVRAALTDKNGLRRGAWSREEDDKLRAYVLRYGHWNWRQLPRFAGLARCGKSCRLRWLNYLRPDVKHGNFSKEEEDLIVQLHKELGNKWSMIASKLPGRTDNEIKNHWHTHLKKSSSEAKKQHCSSETAESVSLIQAQTKDFEVESYTCAALYNPSDHHARPQEQNLPLPQETYTSIDMSECSGNDSTSRMNYHAEDSTITSSSEEVFQNLNGSDFWTEPFLAENTWNHQDGYTSLYGMNFDDGIDWIQQLVQELQEF